MKIASLYLSLLGFPESCFVELLSCVCVLMNNY